MPEESAAPAAAEAAPVLFKSDDAPVMPPHNARNGRRSPLQPMPMWIWKALGVVGGLLLLLLVGGLLTPLLFVPFGALAGLAAFVLVFGGWLWCVIHAFREDATVGVLHLFVPFYPVYYLCTRFPSMWRPWALAGIGTMLTPAAVLAFMYGAAVFFSGLSDEIDRSANGERAHDVAEWSQSGAEEPRDGGGDPDRAREDNAPAEPFAGAPFPPDGPPPPGMLPFGPPPGLAPPPSGRQTVSVSMRMRERPGDDLDESIEQMLREVEGYVAGSAKWNAARRRLTFEYDGSPRDLRRYVAQLAELGMEPFGPPLFKPAEGLGGF